MGEGEPVVFLEVDSRAHHKSITADVWDFVFHFFRNFFGLGTAQNFSRVKTTSVALANSLMKMLFFVIDLRFQNYYLLSLVLEPRCEKNMKVMSCPGNGSPITTV